MLRYLRHELDQIDWDKNGNATLPRALIAEYISRVISAEEDFVALREENDLQRDAIADLSCQVAGLREGLTLINEAYLKASKMNVWANGLKDLLPLETYLHKIGIIAKQAIFFPDPGKEIRERMAKLEAVATAAQNINFWDSGLKYVETHKELVCKLMEALGSLEVTGK